MGLVSLERKTMSSDAAILCSGHSDGSFLDVCPHRPLDAGIFCTRFELVTDLKDLKELRKQTIRLN